VHLFQNFDDEYEINQSAKEIAMGLLMGMADKETGLKIPKNREGCLGICLGAIIQTHFKCR
jgi:hypothetical protein